MLDICLLGTGGMMPMPGRFLTSLAARLNGRMMLIDCGEGTQVTMKMQGWGFKNIDAICFTHFHADHISGLPGLLLTIGNAGRTEPLKLVGPQGLAYVVEGLRRIAPELPFPLELIELGKDTPNPLRLGEFEVSFCQADHMVRCYAYRIDVKRRGKFDPKKAEALGLPRPLWGKLQKEGAVEFEGKTYTPDMVLGPSRRGLKVAYCTDTRPVHVIAEYAEGADLFICEGMYGEDGKEAKAREYKHMTMYEAAALADKAQPEEMWLTHYSPSLTRPEEFMDKVRGIFPRAKAARDGWTKELVFDED